MSANAILAKLSGVRDLGPGRWVALCPGHEDKRASLAIRDLDDGRVLLHCFAGCGTDDVLDALQLRFGDLFPESTAHHFKPERRPFDAAQVLHAIAHECLVVAMIAEALSRGEPTDVERLTLASGRIHNALDAIGEPSVPAELRVIRRGEPA